MIGLGLGLGVSRTVGSGVAPFSPADLAGLALWLTAGPTWCYKDGAAKFVAASSQYLNIADNASLSIGNVDAWGVAWVYADSLGADRVIMGQFGIAGNRAFELRYRTTGSQFNFVAYADGTTVTQLGATTFGTPTTATWYFVMWYHDSVADVIGISVNGGAFDTVALVGGIFDSSAQFTLGAENGTTDFWNGRIDSVAFGKNPVGGIAALATTIRDSLYNGGLGKTYADLTTAEKTAWGLVSFWNLDEATGNRADSHGSNTLTSNNGVTSDAGIASGQCGDGDPVALWRDRSSAAANLSQSTLAARPTLVLTSGKWVVRYDGVDDQMKTAALTWGTSEGTVGSRSAKRSTSSVWVPACTRSNGDEFAQYSNNLCYARNFRAARYDGVPGITDNLNPRTYTQVSGADYRIYFNGAQIGTTQATSWQAPNILVVGANGSPEFSPVDVAGVVLTQAAVSAGERAALESYLGDLL